MPDDVVDERGHKVIIEALVMRPDAPVRVECDDVAAAKRFILDGEDQGEHAGVGVLVDGQPRLWWHDAGGVQLVNADQAARMSRLAAQASEA